MNINLGILGFGGMGNWHANNASEIEGINVLSVHDIDKSRLEDAKKAGYKSYEDRKKFLLDPDINFVLVSVPNHLHKDYCIEALRAGKNVICEKPVTMSVADFDEVIKVSQEENQLFTVHHNRRWDKDYLTMKATVENNLIGKIYSIESKVYGNNGKMYGWRTKPEFGGGLLYDWGVHLLDQFTFMYPYKKIISVFAQKFSVINPDVEDLFKIELLLKDGPSVHIQVGTFSLLKQPRFYAYGDKGTMMIDDFSISSGCIKILNHRIDDMGKVIINTSAGPSRTMAPQPDECYSFIDFPEVEGDKIGFYKNLIQAINGTEDLVVTPSSVRRTMLTLEAAFESAKTHQSVTTNI